MTLAELTTDFQEKLSGVDNTITFAANTATRLINLGWKRAYRKLLTHAKICKQYFNSGKTDVTVDASGYLTLPSRTRTILFLKQKDGQTRHQISLRDAEIVQKNGWVYAGQDSSGNVRVNVYENGVIAAQGTIYTVWAGIAPFDLATAADGTHIASPTIPEEQQGIITDWAAFEYFSRIGISYQGEAGKWLSLANTSTQDAINELLWLDDEPEFIE